MSLLKKNFGEYVTIFIFALLMLVIYYSFVCKNVFDENEHFNEVAGLTWNRNKCEYTLGETLEDELSKNSINKSEKSWDLYFPCGYDNIRNEISEMPIIPKAKYFILDGCDEIVAKEWLWTNVKNHYGRTYTKTLLPTSYVLYDVNDLKLFDKEFDKNKIYIMKKNIQRQEGLKITKNKNEILNGMKNQYVIVQELLQNPYLISGLKTNMRFYVLVMCDGNSSTGSFKVFAHKDGFMYYTKVPFKMNSLDEAPNITTGYIDRKVYEKNPLTHDDLRKYLDDPKRNLTDIEKTVRNQGLLISQIVFGRIYKLLGTVFTAFVGRLCKPSKLSNNLSFQLFGVDIAVDNELNCSIMEVNKGPDLNAKDKRDSELKHGVVQDILKIVGSTTNPDLREPRFVKVLEVENGNIHYTFT